MFSAAERLVIADSMTIAGNRLCAAGSSCIGPIRLLSSCNAYLNVLSGTIVVRQAQTLGCCVRSRHARATEMLVLEVLLEALVI